MRRTRNSTISEEKRLEMIKRYADGLRRELAGLESTGEDDSAILLKHSYSKAKEARRIHERLLTVQLTPEDALKLRNQMNKIVSEFRQSMSKDIEELKRMDTKYNKARQAEQIPPADLDWVKLDYLSRDLERRFTQKTAEELAADFEVEKNSPEGLRAWKDNYHAILQRNKRGKDTFSLNPFYELGERIQKTKYREAGSEEFAKSFTTGLQELQDSVQSIDTVLNAHARENKRLMSGEVIKNVLYEHDPFLFRSELSKLMNVRALPNNKIEVSFSESVKEAESETETLSEGE